MANWVLKTVEGFNKDLGKVKNVPKKHYFQKGFEGTYNIKPHTEHFKTHKRLWYSIQKGKITEPEAQHVTATATVYQIYL